MVTTILTHEVKDFPEWKKIFDADEALRRQIGIKINGLYRSQDDPNSVTIVAES